MIWDDLEWLLSPSRRNDRDGFGMTGLDQEWRDEKGPRRGHPVSHPVILGPVQSFRHQPRMLEQGGWASNDWEWHESGGLSSELSLITDHRNLIRDYWSLAASPCPFPAIPATRVPTSSSLLSKRSKPSSKMPLILPEVMISDDLL